MKPSAVLLLTAAAFLPVAALAKPKSSSSSGGGKGLPPKFGGLIQPAPAVEGGGSKGGLISSELAGKDLEFLTKTIALGRVQSWLVQTAQEKAETPEVRALGGALAEIQTDENRYVAKLASLKGVVFPSAQEVSPEQKALATKMKPLAGPKLEKALVEEIVNAAEKSVAEYESGMQSQDPEIKRLAEQMLPAAKSRLQFASRAAGHAQDTSTRPTFRTGGATRPAAEKVQPKVDAAAPVPLSKPAANPEPTPVRETAAPAPAPAVPARIAATPASNARPASAAPAPAAAKAASTPEAQPRTVKAPAQNIPATTPPPAVSATPAPVHAPAVSATPVPVPPPPVFTPLAPGTTPPPRPPKPTPVSEKSVLPGRPTPPDFTAATIPPLATPSPAPAAPVTLPEPAVATEAPAPEVPTPATPAPQKSRKRK